MIANNTVVRIKKHPAPDNGFNVKIDANGLLGKEAVVMHDQPVGNQRYYKVRTQDGHTWNLPECCLEIVD